MDVALKKKYVCHAFIGKIHVILRHQYSILLLYKSEHTLVSYSFLK